MEQERRILKTGIAHITFLIASLSWFFWLATNRLIARDEGFYTLAAKLINEGKKPYLDFFFPQGPVSANLLAGFFAISTVSWEAARVWAALLSVAASGCVWLYCLRRYSMTLGFLASALLLSCNIFYVWMPTAQTYAPAGFFVLLACTLIIWPEAKQTWMKLFFGGVCLGCAALSRLYLGTLIAPLLLIVFVNYKSSRFRSSILLSFGFLIPLVTFAINYRDTFDTIWFNLIEYHVLRSDVPLLESIPQKVKILKIVLGIAPTAKFEVNQLSYLIWILLGTSMVRFYKSQSFSPWHFLGSFLLIASLAPTPTYVQYFCLLAPFLILALCDDLFLLSQQADFTKNRLAVVIVSCFIILFYARATGADIDRYTKTGKGVIGIYNREAARIWNIDYISKVTRRLDLKTSISGPVFSYWPGFLLESKHSALVGFENHFAIRVADKLKQAEQQKFKIGSKTSLSAALATGKVTAVLLDPAQTGSTMRELLEKQGFIYYPGMAFPLLFTSKNKLDSSQVDLAFHLNQSTDE